MCAKGFIAEKLYDVRQITDNYRTPPLIPIQNSRIQNSRIKREWAVWRSPELDENPIQGDWELDTRIPRLYATLERSENVVAVGASSNH
jgi:hypothetical protein